MLRKVQREIPFSLVERRINPEDPSYARFKEKVPVVFINHEEVFHFRLDERRLRGRLRALVP